MKKINKIVSKEVAFNATASANVSRYMAEVSKIAAQLDSSTYERAAAGDMAAISKVVCANLKLVPSVVKYYDKVSGLGLDDLIQEGNIGLMTAASKYDPDKGAFATLAALSIKQTIIDGTRKYGRQVRLPKHLIADCSIYLEQSGDEIVSVAADGKVTTKFDLFEGGESAEGRTDMTDQEVLINTLLSAISGERDRQIMILLFGLQGNPEMTIKEVADLYGISSEAVRQVKLKSLERMKKAGKLIKESGRF